MHNFVTVLFLGPLLAWQAATGNATPASQDSLKATEAAILAAWEDVDTLSGAGVIRMRLNYEGLNLTASGAGPMVYKREKGRDIMRLSLKGTLAVPAGDIMSEMPVGFEVALDGKRVYAITSALWNKNVVIGDAANNEGVPVPVGPLLFDSLRDNCALSVGRRASVHGMDAYVINATLHDPPSADDPLGAEAFRLYFAQDTGALVRVAAFNRAFKPVGTLDFTNIKVNSAVPPEQFVISIPQDARIYDLRGGKPAKAEYFLPEIPGM